jgi:peptide/nickel transport system ATP-binding protein
MTDRALDVRDLVVRYSGRAVVDGVSFSLNKGDSFGIVGESGSGKSTVLRAIAGLATDRSGTIEVAGQMLGAKRDLAFCRLVQMVFQDPFGSLHPKQTVDRALAEPIAIHGLGDGERRIQEALEAVGLGRGFRFRYPHQLSGGQRQRVAIARALILEPKILLLDEPTSALDVSIQAEVLNLLKRLAAERGMTMLLVSHNLAVVAHMCERIAVMQSGLFVEEAPSSRFRSLKAEHSYTQTLLDASGGFRRGLAEGIGG